MKAVAALTAYVAVVKALALILTPIVAVLVISPATVTLMLCGWSLLERKMFDSPPTPTATRWHGPVVDVASRETVGLPGAAHPRSGAAAHPHV